MVSCLWYHGTMAAAVAVFLLMPAPGRANPVNARGLCDGSQNKYVFSIAIILLFESAS